MTSPEVSTMTINGTYVRPVLITLLIASCLPFRLVYAATSSSRTVSFHLQQQSAAAQGQRSDSSKTMPCVEPSSVSYPAASLSMDEARIKQRNYDQKGVSVDPPKGH